MRLLSAASLQKENAKNLSARMQSISTIFKQYHQYQARLEYLREQRTIQLELEQTRMALLEKWQEKQAALRKERKQP